MSTTELATLRRENEELRGQVEYYESLFLQTDRPVLDGKRLSPMMAVAARILASREFVSHEALDYALFQDEERSSNIAAVYICRLRALLRPLGISIENVWGQGFQIPKADREKLRRLIGSETERAAA